MTKEIALKDLTAVQSINPNSQVLGNLFWFSIGKQLVNAKKLEEHMIATGVDTVWLPKRIRPSDAYRRATKEAERKKVKTDEVGVFYNYLVRDVYSDNEKVVRNIVIEKIDSKGKRLEYNPDACRITLDKTNNNTVTFETTDSVTKEMADEIIQNYNIYKDYYGEQQVRVMVGKILNSLAPIPVRNNGGIYFVPQKFQQQLQALTNFCSALENSEGYKIPVVNSFDSKQMITEKVKSHLESTLAQIKSVENAVSLTKSQILVIVKEAKTAMSDFNEYRNLIDENIVPIKDLEAIAEKIALKTSDVMLKVDVSK